MEINTLVAETTWFLVGTDWNMERPKMSWNHAKRAETTHVYYNTTQILPIFFNSAETSRKKYPL